MPSEDVPRLDSKDAIVVQDGDRTAQASNAKWDAIWTFYKAPCLKQSLGMGGAGGSAIGALRLMTGSGSVAAFTWGAAVAWALAGSTWFVCRRSLYSAAQHEITLLERAQAGDGAALNEYRDIMEARAERTRLALLEREKK